MTRKKEEATAGLRRGRTLATAGLGAATLIGGLVYAAPANAATPTNPTVTVTAPTQISNDGAAATLALGVDNTQAGNLDISGVTYDLTLTVPSGVNCSAVSLTSATFGLAQVGSTCEWQAGPVTLTANTKPAESDTLKITAPAVTGTVTAKFTVETLDSNGFVTHTFGSATGTSTLVAPHAPAFSTTFKGAASAYVPNYSETLVTDPGLSTAGTTYKAAGYYKNPDGTWNTTHVFTVTGADEVSAKASSTATTQDTYLPLRDQTWNTTTSTWDPSGPNFYLDETTGKVVISDGAITAGGTFAAKTPTAPYAPNLTWVVVANDGVGGAPSAGVPANPPTPMLSQFDVASAPFQLSVGFTDVPPTSPFYNDINVLVGANIANGYGDGSFGATKPVSRGQFAAFLARELNANAALGFTYDLGSCTAAATPFQSGFPDVPSSSQFCAPINELAADGVINGYTDGTFRPATVLSRQVVAGMFFRANDVVQKAAVGDAAPVDTKFADVKADNLFSGDINWAVNSSPTTIIQGYGDGTFRPTGVATRQVTAAYLARFGQDYLGLFAGVTGL